MRPRTSRAPSTSGCEHASHPGVGAAYALQRRALSLALQVILLGCGAREAAAQPPAVEFAPHRDFATGFQPISVAVGDLNGDGRLDLAVANVGGNSVSVLMGDGTGAFGPTTDMPAADGPHSIALGDFNGDGRIDMATANYRSGNVSILLGTGGGAFSPATQIPIGGRPYAVEVEDLNADGKLDLAIANNGANNVSVLLGNGDGTFGARADYGAGDLPTYVAIADLNADGKRDLAVVNGNANTVSVLLGISDRDLAVGHCGGRSERGRHPRSGGDGLRSQCRLGTAEQWIGGIRVPGGLPHGAGTPRPRGWRHQR